MLYTNRRIYTLQALQALQDACYSYSVLTETFIQHMKI